MNKLSKEKRNQLVLVLLVTALAVAGLWFGLISFQRQNLKDLADFKAEKERRLAKMEQEIKNTDRLEADVSAATNKLAQLEEDMASGDLFAWMYSNIRRFKLPYKVELPQLSQPELRDVNLVPKFPYKQATFGLTGTGHFHDFGKFLADFENHFPYFRVVNLDLQPEPAPSASDKASSSSEREKLSFRMDIIALIKPGS